MPFAPTPSQSDIMTLLRSFLLAALPGGVEVIQGYDNRVPEPAAADFVVMLPIMRQRLETNIDNYDDTAFTASIAGTQLTVSALAFGAIKVGALLFGANIQPGTAIQAFGSGSGGVGTYTLSLDNGTVASQKMATGLATVIQPINQSVQCDVHGPNAADNAQVISTLFRDEYACSFFAAVSADIAPLYADDPKLVPYLNDSQQIELRWAVTCAVQANQAVGGIPQQFADQLEAGLVNVEAAYPAS